MYVIISVRRIKQLIVLIVKEISQREKEGQLDEGFLAEVSAQLRQVRFAIPCVIKLIQQQFVNATLFVSSKKFQWFNFITLQSKEDGDKPGLEAMLQKVLQLYASKVLSKRSYAKKGIVHLHFWKNYLITHTAMRMVISFIRYICRTKKLISFYS